MRHGTLLDLSRWQWALTAAMHITVPAVERLDTPLSHTHEQHPLTIDGPPARATSRAAWFSTGSHPVMLVMAYLLAINETCTPIPLLAPAPAGEVREEHRTEPRARTHQVGRSGAVSSSPVADHLAREGRAESGPWWRPEASHKRSADETDRIASAEARPDHGGRFLSTRNGRKRSRASVPTRPNRHDRRVPPAAASNRQSRGDPAHAHLVGRG
jgi:hypothetical protein